MAKTPKNHGNKGEIMHEPKVSVLIPVYNTGKTLGRTLDSVLSQTLKEIEIVCVDDGSDEETKAVLRGYAAKDARVKVLTHKENKGLLFARKTAIEAACAPYCMILDLSLIHISEPTRPY